MRPTMIGGAGLTKHLASAFLATLLVVVAGCGGGQQTSSGVKGTLNLAIPTGPELDRMTADAKSFEAANPGTTVKVSVVGDVTNTASYMQLLPDMLKNGDADVAWMQHQNQFSAIQKAGLLQSVDDVWQDPNLGLAQAIPQAYKTLWTDGDGHQHGVPTDIVMLPLLWYNVDEFAKAGVQPPANGAYYTSNQQLYDAIAKLKAAGFGGLTITGNVPYWFDHQMSGLANNLLKPSEYVALTNNATPGTKPTITWDDPRVVKIFQTQQEYLNQKIYPNGFLARDYDTSRALFDTGKAAMDSDGSWVTPSFAKEAPNLKYGWMLYPQQRPDITPTFGVTAVNGLVMSANSRNKDLSKAFVRWVMSKPRQEAIAAVGGLTPSRTDISAEALKGQGPVLSDILSHFKSVGVGFWWEDNEPLAVAKAVDDGLSLLMAGQTTPEQIAKSAEAAATKLRLGQ